MPTIDLKQLNKKVSFLEKKIEELEKQVNEKIEKWYLEKKLEVVDKNLSTLQQAQSIVADKGKTEGKKKEEIDEEIKRLLLIRDELRKDMEKIKISADEEKKTEKKRYCQMCGGDVVGEEQLCSECSTRLKVFPSAKTKEAKLSKISRFGLVFIFVGVAMSIIGVFLL